MATQTHFPQIRQMLIADMDKIMLIQATCYGGGIPESRASLCAKLVASPASCFVAVVGEDVVAYLIALPWLSQAPPALHAPACEVPAYPDCIYLHDLSVLPAARGTGIAGLLIAHFFVYCRQSGMTKATLVAVQSSAIFWRGFGFNKLELDLGLTKKLATYGHGAEFLMCDISPEV
ncbi:GNAT family N-acetyltransferase [Undibacterium sp.]|uniref:GNAT family N-acetyltransferase n=1 Tax=Undibacterium sp. TaxID=1914977 RepID=UPI0037528AD8